MRKPMIHFEFAYVPMWNLFCVGVKLYKIPQTEFDSNLRIEEKKKYISEFLIKFQFEIYPYVI